MTRDELLRFQSELPRVGAGNTEERVVQLEEALYILHDKLRFLLGIIGDGVVDNMEGITSNGEMIQLEVTRATESEGQLSSRITQTAEAITSEVTRATASEGQLSSRITQTAEDITAEVTRASGAESLINQKADGIKAQVTDEYGNYTVLNLKSDGLHIGNQQGQSMINGTSLRFYDDDNKNCLYYDSQKGTFVFDGTLGSDAVFTDSLYAEQGDVAELTVDRLSTSRRIRLYLLRNTSDDLFVRIQDRTVQWVSAVPNGGGGTEDGPLMTEASDTLTTEDGDVLIAEISVSTEQAYNRYGEPLYWQKDITNAVITSEGYPYVDGLQVFTTVKNTGFPVMVYSYTEQVKMQIAYENDGVDYTPIVTLGAGDENGHSKAVMSKTRTGVRMQYDRSGGTGKIGWELNNAGQFAKTIGNALWPVRGVMMMADVSVPVSAWVADASYSAYPYRADITVTAAETGMTANAVADPDDESSISRYAKCGNGIVSIYAAAIPAAAVTIRHLEVMA